MFTFPLPFISINKPQSDHFIHSSWVLNIISSGARIFTGDTLD